MSNQVEAKRGTDEGAAWASVRDAITERWPHINRDELAECKNETCRLVDFVKERVSEGHDEIESVVSEFAPQESIVDKVAHSASDQVQRASEAAQFAYMRADECISERPTESVLTGFFAGVVVGVTVTALLMRSKPAPSAWDRVKSRSYF
ncbi:hypothetical protein [Allorhodopirellula heiligendammensis]|uniref:DUF883 domain-containing protein n=1 Tax=Allorhodopirellula heiligendammensis TaxID=2714739 RepID=A0A5C6BEM2_9BACT|nr:hypothetical protein [Allorhodopirellula heiligendammensis]TWU10107.1 hypothetical protein Poly21_50760 [Allorhodopirellula heiligendammensis]